LDTNFDKDRVVACDNGNVNGGEIKFGQDQNTLGILVVLILSLKLSDD
jgi:hypothetical protein